MLTIMMFKGKQNFIKPMIMNSKFNLLVKGKFVEMEVKLGSVKQNL